MSNLWTGTLEANSEYTDLATLSEQTFTKGDKIQIQIQNPAYIREGNNGDGFLVMNNKPFVFEYDTDEIYVKSLNQPCVINLSDSVALTF